LLFSNFQEPEGWDAKNVIIVGGSGKIQAIASTGSILLILKDTEAYILLGESAIDFTLLPIAKKGTIAPDSVISVEGVVFWLADDGVRMFDGRKIEYIGNEIRGILDSLPLETKRQAVAAFGGGRYLLSLPNHLTLAYDLVTTKWEIYSWSSDFIISAFDEGGINRFILNRSPNNSRLATWPGNGYTDIDSPPYWYLEKDLISGYTVATPRGPGFIKAIKRFRELEIIAPPQAASIFVNLVVDGDSGPKALAGWRTPLVPPDANPLPAFGSGKSYVTFIDLSDAPKSIRLPPGLVGKTLKIRISGTQAVELHGFIIWGYLERPYGKN